MLLADKPVTLVRTSWVPTIGLVTMGQAVPFQCRMRLRSTSLAVPQPEGQSYPTDQTLVGENARTAER